MPVTRCKSCGVGWFVCLSDGTCAACRRRAAVGALIDAAMTRFDGWPVSIAREIDVDALRLLDAVADLLTENCRQRAKLVEEAERDAREAVREAGQNADV